MTILPSTSLPPSSLFFSLPTEVIIGMWVWRSQLIDDNVLLPDNRARSECKKRLFFKGATGMIGMFLIKGLSKVGFYINWMPGD